MATPHQNQSDEELKRALAEGQLGERKAAVAEELLRRRRQERWEELAQEYKWLAVFVAAAALLSGLARSLWRRRT